TRAPGPTPALRRPAATHNTRFWKARRSSVPAESVTAGPDGSSSDHAINAPSVRGYSGPYVFRIRTIPIDQRSALRTFWQTSFHCWHTSSASQVTRPRGAGLGEAHVSGLEMKSASLIGRLGQALSGYPPTPVRCRSRARASLRTWHKGPSIMGFEDEVEQSFGRPCRQCNGRLKQDMRTHLIHRPARDIIPPLGGSQVFSYLI